MLFIFRVIYESESDLVSRTIKRSAAENVAGIGNSSLILAEARTYGKDPYDSWWYDYMAVN